MKQAQEQNADEAIILNERDEVCEAASCNLFIVKDEQIFTPGLESGCLDGVFRKKLIHYLRQHYPEQIIILPMSREALLEADEIWLTNAVQGLKRYFLNPNTKGSSSSILQAIQEALMNDATFLEQEN
jgi:branched-subunit amino acid aminotransferase/4-amino-4-deoxychorismate lyase